MQLKMRNRETEQKDILLMTGIFRAGGDLQIDFVVGLALFFDLFPTCCRQPDLYPLCGGKAMARAGQEYR